MRRFKLPFPDEVFLFFYNRRGKVKLEISFRFPSGEFFISDLQNFILKLPSAQVGRDLPFNLWNGSLSFNFILVLFNKHRRGGLYIRPVTQHQMLKLCPFTEIVLHNNPNQQHIFKFEYASFADEIHHYGFNYSFLIIHS